MKQGRLFTFLLSDKRTIHICQDTGCCFNVYKTSTQRRIDVLWTLKQRWVSTA